MENMIEKRLIVIGGGPAGLAAAISACESGIAPGDILVIERDRELGGILNQCIHAGFGLHLFGEELTGPEYAGRFVRRLYELGIDYVCDSMVIGLSEDRVVSFVSPKMGFCRMRAGAVVLAMGCRERTRGALNIPGTRPAGIFSAGTAQRFVNIEGWMPGKRVVILGSGDIGLIMARRLTLEGAQVLRVCEVMPYSGGLARNIAQCLDDFGIPLYLSHTVTEIRGRDRVESVVIAEVDENRNPIAGTEEVVECDTLLLSVGLIPENELTRGAGIEMDPVTGGAVVNQFMETSSPGVFACGNVLQVHDLVDFVTEESRRAGAAAAKSLTDGLRHGGAAIPARAGAGVRYVVPQKLASDGDLEGVKLFFRVSGIFRDAELLLKADGEVIRSLKRRVMTPGEMENILLRAEDAEKIRRASEIEVSGWKK